MEVISHADHDTHSIMGGGKRHAATVNLNSGLITTLSTSLYSDNFLATVREVICNGWDAHKVSGRTAIPLEVNLTETSLTIQDFGPGIPHQKMGAIYLDYGGSTKVADENQTGGFGLGSKSPFSYTDFFNVENNHGGTKGVYTVSRGSAETDGMPDIIEMIKVPTTDEGLTVEIPIASAYDVQKFTQVIRDVIILGGINAKFNGELLTPMPLDHSKEGIIFTDRKPYIVNGLLYVRYGNVIYPIKEHRDYADLYKQATNAMNMTQYTREHGYNDHVRQSRIAIFDALPNTLSVVPSREDLHSSPRTVNTIRGLLEKFIEKMHPLEGSTYILKKEREILEEMVAKGQDIRPMLLGSNIIMKHYKSNRDRFFSITGDFLSVDELTICLAANGQFYDAKTLFEARKVRINMACEHSKSDKDLLKKLRDLLTEYPSIWTNAYHYCGNPVLSQEINPILRKAAAANLDPKGLINWEENKDKGRKTYAGTFLYQTVDNFQNLVRFTKRLVMVVPNRGAIKQYKWETHKPDNWQSIPEDGCLVYVMPKGKYKPNGKFSKNWKKMKPSQWATYDQTIQFFARQGYEIIDIVKVENERRVHNVKFNIEPVKKISAPAYKKPKDQYVSIMNLMTASKAFDYRRHLDVDKSSLVYMSNPVAIFQGTALGAKMYSPRFFAFGDEPAKTILELYSDKIAIARSVVEQKKAMSEGAQDGNTWIVEQVCKDLIADENYKAVLQMENTWGNHRWLNSIEYNSLRKTKSGAHLPDLPVLSSDNNKLVELFDFFTSRSNRSCFTEDQRKLLMETGETLIQWKKTQAKDLLKGFFAEDARSRLNAINYQRAISVILDEDASPRDVAYNEALLSMALYG